MIASLRAIAADRYYNNVMLCRITCTSLCARPSVHLPVTDKKRSVLFLHTKTSHRSRLPIGRAGREMRVCSSESHLGYVGNILVGLEMGCVWPRIRISIWQPSQ